MSTHQELEEEISRIAKLVQEPSATEERDTVVITTPIPLLAAGEVLQNWILPQTYFIANRAYLITSIQEVHDTAQTAADGCSLQVVKNTGTVAPGSSDINLITNTAYSGSGRVDKGFDQKGIAANTVTTGTLTNQVASLTLAAGDRLVWGMNGTASTTFISLTTTLSKV